MCSRCREFPWAKFSHTVGLHIGCASLRAAAHGEDVRDRASRSSRSRSTCCRRSRAFRFVTPERPDECCGFGGTFSVFEEPVSAKMGYDKVTDHQQRRCGVHRLRRHVLPHASEGMRRAARRSTIKFIHIAQILNGAQGAHEQAHRPRGRRPRSSSRPRTISTFTTSGCGICARSATGRASTFPSGKSCGRWRRRSRSTR